MIWCVLFSREHSGSFNVNTGVKQGCVVATTLFSTFLAAFITLAAFDQAKGVGIIYRTDGELMNMCRLKAKPKVKATFMCNSLMTVLLLPTRRPTYKTPLILFVLPIWVATSRRRQTSSRNSTHDHMCVFAFAYRRSKCHVFSERGFI